MTGAPAGKYHLRRAEKALTDEEMLEIIRGQRLLTLAMAVNNEPYQFTVNYGYDEDGKRFFFHCATEGKKIDIIKANPAIWGQIIEDAGYIDGACDHAYRSVHFSGEARIIEDLEEKAVALGYLIDHQESDPSVHRKRLEVPEKLKGVGVVEVTVDEFTGKGNLPKD